MRFASRFSRARVRTASAVGGPYVQRGEDFGGFLGKLENPGFQVLGKSEKVGPTSRPDFGAFQIAVSRARPIKNILAGPHGSGGPPEPSGPARIFFTGRARETAIWNAPRASRKSANS